MRSEEAAALGNSLLAEFTELTAVYSLRNSVIAMSVIDATELWDEVCGDLDSLLPLLTEPYGEEESAVIACREELAVSESKPGEKSAIRAVSRVSAQVEPRRHPRIDTKTMAKGHTGAEPFTATGTVHRAAESAYPISGGHENERFHPNTLELKESGAESEQPEERIDEPSSTPSQDGTSSPRSVSNAFFEDTTERVGGFRELASVLGETAYTEQHPVTPPSNLRSPTRSGTPDPVLDSRTNRMAAGTLPLRMRRVMAIPGSESQITESPVVPDPNSEVVPDRSGRVTVIAVPDERASAFFSEISRNTGELARNNDTEVHERPQLIPDMDEIVEALTEIVALDYRRFYGS